MGMGMVGNRNGTVNDSMGVGREWEQESHSRTPLLRRLWLEMAAMCSAEWTPNADILWSCQERWPGGLTFSDANKSRRSQLPVRVWRWQTGAAPRVYRRDKKASAGVPLSFPGRRSSLVPPRSAADPRVIEYRSCGREAFHYKRYLV